MRRLGHSGKVDSNHVEIVDFLRAHGWSAHSTASLGHGFPDILVSADGRTALVEVKRNKGEQLTPDQVKFRDNWDGPVIVAVSGEDALEQLERLLW